MLIRLTLAAILAAACHSVTDYPTEVHVLETVAIRENAGWPSLENPIVGYLEPTTSLKVTRVTYEKEMMYLRVESPSGPTGWLMPGPEIEIKWAQGNERE